MLLCETHDLVWEIISVSEKRMTNCTVKIIDECFRKKDEGGLFPLTLSGTRHFAKDSGADGGALGPAVPFFRGLRQPPE